MLTPEQIEGFRLAAGRLIDPINTYLLKDIARRIQDAGKLTSTAAYEAWRAGMAGEGPQGTGARPRPAARRDRGEAEEAPTHGGSIWV